MLAHRPWLILILAELAASKKSLSREDTDLLSITLSTLYLLDTLMHLLRRRADTIDLLAYRLDWESMRFLLAKEALALEKDMRKFVYEKAWSINLYEDGLVGNGPGGSEGASKPRRFRSFTSISVLYTSFVQT